MNNAEKAQTIGGLAMVLIALGVVAYAVVMTGSESALGALISILAAGTGYFLRGRVESPKE